MDSENVKNQEQNTADQTTGNSESYGRAAGNYQKEYRSVTGRRPAYSHTALGFSLITERRRRLPSGRLRRRSRLTTAGRLPTTPGRLSATPAGRLQPRRLSAASSGRLSSTLQPGRRTAAGRISAASAGLSPTLQPGRRTAAGRIPATSARRISAARWLWSASAGRLSAARRLRSAGRLSAARWLRSAGRLSAARRLQPRWLRTAGRLQPGWLPAASAHTGLRPQR